MKILRSMQVKKKKEKVKSIEKVQIKCANIFY